MSFLTGTQTELLYAYGGASTDLATFTTEDNLQKTYPECQIPSEFFGAGGRKSTSLKVKAAGRISTFTSGTFTFSLRLLTSTTWSAGGVLLGATAAITMVASQTLLWIFFDVDIMLRTLGIGAATTLVTTGVVESGAIASPFFATVPAGNTAPTSTIDASTTYYLFLSAASSVSNAANLVNLQQLKVYGEN